jgi:RHS repeat-associated protein
MRLIFSRLQPLFFLLLLITVFTLPGVNLKAQLLSGGPDGTPSEVTASPINEGSVSGEVNLFSGTYDLTQTLGTVSTVSGPSFTLTSSYSSVVSSGTLSPRIKGGPYGEGWSLNLPRISCNIEDYEKFNSLQKDFIASKQGYHMMYRSGEVTVEKSLHFLNLNFSIPGVGSGKLNYKYSIGGAHHFSPNTFEQPLTVILRQGIWEIIAPNGDEYTFLPVVSIRKNGNLRTHRYTDNYVGGSPPYNMYSPAYQPDNNNYPQVLNIFPRQAVAEWYIGRISNPISTESISFKSESYGSAIDHFSNWKQGSIRRLPVTAPYDGMPDISLGYHLTEIRSSTEVLKLEYGDPTFNGEADENCGVFMCKELVFDSEDDDSGQWRRFRHVAKPTDINTNSGITQGVFGSATNPYVHDRGSSQLNMNFDRTTLPASFSHSYFESPGLPALSQGSYYGVEFSMGQVGNPVLLDVNIVGGKTIIEDGDNIGDFIYKGSRSIDVFNTFQDPLKYYAHDQNDNNFESYFLAPQLHPTNKVFIQIGPANSDAKYGEDIQNLALCDQFPPMYRSYYNNDATGSLIYDSGIGLPHEIAGDQGIYPTDRLSNSFGIGMPWDMMSNFYNDELTKSPIAENPQWIRNNDEPVWLNPRWWRLLDGSDTGCGNWDNNPTLAGEDVVLNRVKVYKYTKKLRALLSVKKYVVGSGVSGTPTVADVNNGNFEVEVNNTQFQYKRQLDDYYIGYREQAVTGVTPIQLGMTTLLLRRIVSTPVGVELNHTFPGGTPSYPATTLSYRKVDNDIFDWTASIDDLCTRGYPLSDLLPNAKNVYLVSSMINPLGKITRVNYNQSASGMSLLGCGSSFLTGSPNLFIPGIKRPLEANFAVEVRGIVNSVRYEGQEGTFRYIYRFQGEEDRLVYTKPHKNLKDSFLEDISGSVSKAFSTVRVTGPLPLGGGPTGPYSVYQHSTDRILWGKMLESYSYDEAGELVSSSENSYSYQLAFEPGFARASRQSNPDANYITDYSEYATFDKVSPPINDAANSGEFKSYINQNISHPDFNVVSYSDGPKIGGQYLYGPYSPIPDFSNYTEGGSISFDSQFDPEIDGYAPENILLTEGSFFIKLNSSSSISYISCEGGGNSGITETTTYTYYDATYDGLYEPSVYEKLGYELTDIGIDGRLFREPSFLVASKTTGNSASMLSSQEEYFYLWDLKNVGVYNNANNTRIADEFNLLQKLTEREPIRNLTYEVRTTHGDGTVQSSFNEYSAEVPYELTEYVQIVDETLVYCGEQPEDFDPCENNNTPSQSCPDANGCITYRGQIPFGFCPLETPFTACPCEEDNPDDDEGEVGGSRNAFDSDVDFQGLGLVTNFNNFGFLDGDGGGPPSAIPTPDARFTPVLKSVHVQIEEENQVVGPRISFSEGLHSPQINVPTLRTYNLLLRNVHNLPATIEDVKGLKTHFEYAPVTVLHYRECIREEFIASLTATFSESVGLPVAVTVGYELPDELRTEYIYNNKRLVSEMTDPNGIVLEYGYDEFSRLETTKRNGDLLSENSYHNYNNVQVPFTNAREQNFLKTTNYLGNGGQNVSNSFIDPLGRPGGTVVTYTGGTGAGGGHTTGAVYYDQYGRVLASDPIGGNSSFLTSTGSDKVNYEYAAAPRTDQRKLARKGLSLSGDNLITTNTCLVSPSRLSEEVLASGNQTATDFVFAPGEVLRTESYDEDGNKSVSYSEGAGLVLATFSYLDPEASIPYAATVNAYDGRGNLLATVNPKGHITSYEYNYLGQVYETSSPDAGTSQVLYDVEGKILASKDGDDYLVYFNFDRFGRQIAKTKVENASLIDFDTQGLPWLPLAVDGGDPASYVIDVEGDREKIWQYNTSSTVEGFTTDLPSGFSAGNALGRIAAVYSCDDDGVPIHGTVITYDENGFVSREMSVFSSTNGEYVDYKINYSDFLLTGAAGTVAVDVSNDGNDFTHHFAYDGLGRVTEVSVTAPEAELSEELLAEYVYDGTNGQVEITKYTVGGDEVELIKNTYDVANRLTTINSRLFSEQLVYDADGGGYFNGNISSTIATYNIDQHLAEPSMMSAPSKYNYQYDGLNRLTGATLEVDASIFDAFENVTGNLDNFGRTSYDYDVVGNLLKMSRGEFNQETEEAGSVSTIYKYEPSNNQLQEVTLSGLGYEQATSYAYSYNGNGYLTVDGKRDQEISYTRGTYPLTAAGESYLYDANDARILKNGDKTEFYLRNSSGQELGIIDLDDLNATWYCFGLNRFAQIGTSVGDCGPVACRPSVHDTPEDATAYDEQVLQNMEATVVGDLLYPQVLYRVQLPSGNDFHVLGGELENIAPYVNILQQVLIHTESDLLVVEEIDPDAQTEMTFAEFLEIRNDNPQNYLVNGFHVCEQECSTEVFTCNPQITEEQLTELNRLRFSGLENGGDGSVENLTAIVRIRLCSGVETYLPQSQLVEIPGAWMVLQTIEINDPDNLKIFLEEGEQTDNLIGLEEVRPYLYQDDTDWSLDYYEGCVGELVCTDEVPECGPNGLPDFSNLPLHLRTAAQNAQNISFPFTVQRVRFCDGTDLHLTATELNLLAAGSHTVLQTVTFSSATSELPVWLDDDEARNMGAIDFLSFRANHTVTRMADYPECPADADCEAPECKVEDRKAQDEFIANWIPRYQDRLLNVNYPVNFVAVITCSGEELWLTKEELQAMPGEANIVYLITIPAADSEFGIQTNDGNNLTGTLATALQLAAEENLLSVNGFLSCNDRTEENCLETTTDIVCNPAMISAQNAALDLLRGAAEPCKATPSPWEIYRVRLCSGETHYLLRDELETLPGRIELIQTVPLPENQETIRAVVNGELTDLTAAEILCDHIDRIELLESPGCQIYETPGESVKCEVMVTQASPSATAEPDSYTVDVSVSSVIEERCDDGSPTRKEVVTEDVEDLQVANCYTMNFSGADIKVMPLELQLTEVPTGVLQGYKLAAEELASQYPGLSGYLQSHQSSLDDLTLEEYTDEAATLLERAMNATLQYIADDHFGVTSSEYNFRYRFAAEIVEHVPGNPYLHVELCVGVIHQPKNIPGFMADACSSTLTFGLVKKDKVFIQHLDPSIYVFRDLSKYNPIQDQLCGLAYGCTQVSEGKSTTAEGCCIPKEGMQACASTFGFPFPTEFNCLPESGELRVQLNLLARQVINEAQDLTLVIDNKQPEQITEDYTCETIGQSTFSLKCELSTLTVCQNGNCEGNTCDPALIGADCTPAEIDALDTQLTALESIFSGANAGAMIYPVNVAVVAFCGNTERYLLPAELGNLTVSYRIVRRLEVESAEQTLQILTTNDGTSGNLAAFLSARAQDATASFRLAPQIDDDPVPGVDPVTGYPPEYNVAQVSSPVTFFLHDHLGNTRVTFAADGPTDISIRYAADFYPYGKILREYKTCEAERFLTTHHERDKGTGYDNRGARLYDAEIGRFLGVDPLAGSFGAWSPYNYVVGNPILMTDPDGRNPIVGAILGAGVELVTQIVTNAGTGKPILEIDLYDVGVSAFSGAVTSGASLAGPGAKLAKLAFTVAEEFVKASTDVTVSKSGIEVKSMALGHEEKTPLGVVLDTGLSVGVGELAKASGKVLGDALNSTAGFTKKADDLASRADKAVTNSTNQGSLITAEKGVRKQMKGNVETTTHISSVFLDTPKDNTVDWGKDLLGIK